MSSASLITRVCCEAVRSAILATAWLLVKTVDILFVKFIYGNKLFIHSFMFIFSRRTNGRTYGTVLRPSVAVCLCDVMYCG